MSSLRFVSQWPIQCSVWRSVNLNDYTEQYMVISLRLAAIILALSISLVRLKCIETHARRKIWQKKLMAVCIQWNDLSGHIFLYRFRGDMARPQSLLLKKKRRNTSAETRRVNAFLKVSYSSQLKQKKRRKKKLRSNCTEAGCFVDQTKLFITVVRLFCKNENFRLSREYLF